VGKSPTEITKEDVINKSIIYDNTIVNLLRDFMNFKNMAFYVVTLNNAQ
jgi:hypothetical protein